MQYHSTAVVLALAAGATALSIPQPRQAAVTSAQFDITRFHLSSASFDGGSIYSMDIAGQSPVNAFSYCYWAPASSGDNQYCANTPPIDGFAPQGCENHAFSWSISEPLPPTPGSYTPRYILQANWTQPDGPVLSGCYLLTGDFYCAPSDVENPGQTETYTDTYIGSTNFTMTLEENPSCVFA